MKSVIYKYVLDFDSLGNANITIPDHSTLLKVGVQNDQIVLWYKIDESGLSKSGKYTEKFKVIMTGEHFEDNGNMEYIDTVTLKEWIVCHLFMLV